VGEHASLGCLSDEVGIGRVQQHDHGARGFADDLVDQSERVLGALTESEERDVGSFAGGHCADVFDVDFAGDHLVAERDDDRSDERETVLAVIGDQDAEMLGLALAHERLKPSNL
jgi:hypothetical protein